MDNFYLNLLLFISCSNISINSLKNKGVRVELDDRNEKLGYRLREAQTKKVPYTLILGDQEKENIINII